MNEMEDLDIMSYANQVFITNKQTVLNEYHIYFDEDVKSPAYYRGALETLGLAHGEDVVVLHINTVGGALSSASSLYNAIRDCSAAVIGVIEFECSSAGAILAMACDKLIVKPFSVMMIHNVQGGAYGDYANSLTQMNFFQDAVSKLYKEAYIHFLTEKEISDVLTTGKELWLTAEDIDERWQARDKLYSEED